MNDENLSTYFFFKDKYKNTTKEDRVRFYNLLRLETEDIESNRTLVEDKSQNLLTMVISTITTLLAIDKFAKLGGVYDNIILGIMLAVAVIGFIYVTINNREFKKNKKIFDSERKTIYKNKLELQALKDLLKDENNIIL